MVKDWIAAILAWGFDHSPATVRSRLVGWLAAVGTPAADERVVRAAADPRSSVRLAAAKAMESCLRPAYREPLLAILQDSDQSVRVAAAGVVGVHRLREAGDHLLPFLTHRDPTVRAAGAWALGRLRSLDFSDHLARLVEDPDPDVRAEAVRSLGAVGHEAALVRLRRVTYRDPVLRNRDWAREAIAGIEARRCSIEEKRRRAAVDLIHVLADKRRPPELRRRASECIRRLRYPSVVSTLCQAVEEHNDIDFHEEIVHILATFPPSQALQDGLVKFIRHVSRRVRRPAITALGRVGDRDKIFFLGDIVRLGRQPNQPFDADDALLAEQAIKEIDLRTGRKPWPGGPAPVGRGARNAEKGEVITCVDCGRRFMWSYGEQRYYRERGLSPPKRCPACRSSRKQARDSGMQGHAGPRSGPQASTPTGRWSAAAKARSARRSPSHRRWPPPGWAKPEYRFGLVTFGLALAATAAIWWYGYLLDVLQSWLIAINSVAFLTYGYDKAVAGRGWTRVPETVLIALAFAGGTVGAWLGMWLFRHKTAKASFRLKFWLFVATQIVLAVVYYAWIEPRIG